MLLQFCPYHFVRAIFSNTILSGHSYLSYDCFEFNNIQGKTVIFYMYSRYENNAS